MTIHRIYIAATCALSAALGMTTQPIVAAEKPAADPLVEINKSFRTTYAARRAEILKRAETSDIVYLKVSNGRTGSYAQMSDGSGPLRETLALLKTHCPELLIAAGVGIQDPGQVAAAAGFGIDMIVVGTALMEKMSCSFQEMSDWIESLHRAARHN